MAFTYQPDLSDDVSKLRFELGDIVENTGILPDGTNVQDETLQSIITTEGSVGLAAARMCEILSRMWTRYAGSVSVGARSETFRQAEIYRDMAASLRSQYGGGARAVSVEMYRDDGYHENNEHDADSSEYETDTKYIRTS